MFLHVRQTYVAAHKSKTKKPIPIPLNAWALAILSKQLQAESTHGQYVFTCKGKPVHPVNTAVWRKALKRAGIRGFLKEFRWHVQAGTSLHELQQLGGWTSHEMVL